MKLFFNGPTIYGVFLTLRSSVLVFLFFLFKQFLFILNNFIRNDIKRHDVTILFGNSVREKTGPSSIRLHASVRFYENHCIRELQIHTGDFMKKVFPATCALSDR